MIDKRLQGKRNRAAGQRFELKVRKDLEAKGWVVDRWSNNVDLDQDKLVAAKSRFGSRTNGFPDFIAMKPTECLYGIARYTIWGIECKSAKYLDKTEKAKCKWLLKNHVFSEIYIVSKGKKRGETVYKKFLKKVHKNKS